MTVTEDLMDVEERRKDATVKDSKGPVNEGVDERCVSWRAMHLIGQTVRSF